MAYSPPGPGKTAPRLLADLLVFDPLKASSQTTNILTSHCSQITHPPITQRADACRHDYSTKIHQSSLPPPDSRPDEKTFYKIATTCKRCRIHLDVSINYTHSTDCCPNAVYPLHHFQRLQSQDQLHQSYLRYAWQCSSPTCRAFLTVTYKPPRISSEYINLLTNTALLKQRYTDIVEDDPHREGIKQATPVDTLSRLRKYIKDALNPAHSKRIFPANNKRFMEAFGLHGRDCSILLKELGFKYDEHDVTWTLPDAPTVDVRRINDPSHPALDLQDVEMELFALVDKLARDMNLPNPAATETWPSANQELQRVLAAQGYDHYRGPRYTVLGDDHDARYASLGALKDFSNDLILFCYERQILCDPDERNYYVECLQEIGSWRTSDEITMKTKIAESEGLYSKRDLAEAYNAFHLPYGGGGADDERILNLFQAQSSDLGQEAGTRARDMLYRLGMARQSRLLINAASQTIETVEEALAWLGNGVDKDTADDMILTVFTLRTDGDPSKEEIGRKAVEVIAKARQSSQLHTWLETGRTDGYTMSTDEALRHLDITQSIETVDETLWPSIFDNARLSRPGEQTDKAIAAIQQALAGASSSTYSASNWPVGLTSLGNTCYLNSLLQYYFSLKPLRDIVLNYDQFKFDLETSHDKTERVGQRQISPLEIKGGQKFAEDLRHLFERMIRDPSSAVKPEQDLVCRAFLDPKDSDLWDNKDKSSDEHALEEVKEYVVPESANASQDTILPDAAAPAADSDAMKADESQDTKMIEMPQTPPETPELKPQEVAAPPLPPRRFSTTTNAALERAQSNATQQQDVTEVHDGIQFRLRAGMRPLNRDSSGEQIDELLQLFSIQLLDIPVKDGVPLKAQPLMDSAIQLNVLNEPTDIYSALDAIFDLQPVDSDGRLERFKSIASLPPFLQINIPRVGFNKEKGEQFKSEHSIRLVDELFLDRYFAQQNDNINDRRRSAWGWRRTLTDLKKEQTRLRASSNGLDGPAAVAETSKYLDSISAANEGLDELGIEPITVDPALSVALNNNAQQQGARLEELNGSILNLEARLADLFQPFQEIKYRLQAVFFHRGKTAHGHYWICIRDFSTGIWRRYNDERVEEVSNHKLNEIFEANDWAHGTPTYAVYVRDDLKEQIVQPVCRQPDEAASNDLQSTASAALQNVGDSTQPSTTVLPVQETQSMIVEGGENAWDKPRTIQAGTTW